MHKNLLNKENVQQIAEKIVNEPIKQFLKEHQWYGIAKSGKKVPLGMNRSEEEHEVHIALQEERPQPPLPSIPPPTVLQSCSSADETRVAVEHVFLKKEEDVGTEMQKSVTPSKIKSKQKKIVTEAPRAKSEAEWKAEIEANFPLSSFKLETVDFDLFQTSAAALLHCLVDDPNYADLFEGLAEAVREGIRNIEKWDYCFGINDAPAIRALKKFVQKKINEKHYPTYLAKQIALAKSRAEEQERLSKLSTEAEQRLLAELEGETKTTQKASVTKKPKSKK